MINLLCLESNIFRKSLVLISVFLLFSSYIFSQETKARIGNVDFYYDEEAERLIITYDILKSSSTEKYEIGLQFLDDEGTTIYPTSTVGDVGLSISGGSGKRISWDIFGDVDEIAGNIKAIVNINSVTVSYGGPSKAVLSLLVPGLGDYQVANAGNMIIKPYFKTVAAYGFIAYGMVQNFKAKKLYDDYLASTDQSEFDDLYDQATKANHQAYIATGIGIVVWAADVVWVVLKGSKNMRTGGNYPSAMANGFTMNYRHTGINFGYVIRF